MNQRGARGDSLPIVRNLTFVMLGLVMTACHNHPESTPGRGPAVLNTDRSTLQLDTFAITPPSRFGYSGGFRFVPRAADTLFERDSLGLPVFRHDGTNYTHPLQIARFATRMRNSFVQTGDSAYLALARVAIDRIAEDTLQTGAFQGNSALWLAYPFNFRLHSSDGRGFFVRWLTYPFGYRFHAKDAFTLSAPWYSGMTEGVCLEAAVALFETTKDSVYLKLADKLYKSFDLLRGESEPWTVRIDSAGYYWIEEYPADLPGRTLNGAIIGMGGLYEYAFYTGSKDAKRYVRAALATFAHYANDFRRPGELSYYCLGHKSIASRSYHLLHISLFRQLGQISANPFFAGFADSLQSDLERYDLNNQ